MGVWNCSSYDSQQTQRTNAKPDKYNTRTFTPPPSLSRQTHFTITEYTDIILNICRYFRVFTNVCIHRTVLRVHIKSGQK